MLSLACSLAVSVLLFPLLLLTCQPVRALKMLRYSYHLPPLRVRAQMARAGAFANAASDERAAARAFDAAGMAKIASADDSYQEAIEVEPFSSGGCLSNSTMPDYLPPPAEPAAEWAAPGAVTLAIPGGGHAFLWREAPRADRVKQGGVGSCWLIATIAAAGKRKGVIERCFPAAGDDDLPPGACPVALYDVDGTRRTLPLDTRLYYKPLLDEESSGPRTLAYASSKDRGKQELWGPMLEKGMAHLMGGSYRAVHGDVPSRALFALTGASIEVVSLDMHDSSVLVELAAGQAAGDIAVASSIPSPLLKLLAVLLCPLRCIFAHVLGLSVVGVTDLTGCLCPRSARSACSSFARAHCFHTFHILSALKDALMSAANLAAAAALVPINLMCCCCTNLFAPTFNGILGRHAYSVLSDHRVSLTCCGIGCGSERIVRVRNPHGAGGLEWRGKWSDTSIFWRCVSDAEKDRVHYKWSDASYCAKRCPCGTEWPCCLVCFPFCYYNKSAFGRTETDDGTFFMSEADFIAVFDRVDVCHARPGWTSITTAATLAGTCAYFTIHVDDGAPTLPRVRRVRAAGSAAAAQHSVVRVRPLATSSPGRGVLASVAIAAPDVAKRFGAGVRISVFDDATRRPVASTQQKSARNSFTSRIPGVGTSVATLLAGHTYTVFAQWGGGFSCDDRGGIAEPCAMSLIVTASDAGALTVTVPPSAPSPPLPWAPVGPTAYGECAKRGCGLALPADFAFLLGERYHRECAPEISVCGRQVL